MSYIGVPALQMFGWLFHFYCILIISNVSAMAVEIFHVLGILRVQDLCKGDTSVLN